MQLKINDNSNLLNSRFANWLCKRLFFNIVEYIEKDNDVFDKFDSYIEKNNTFSILGNTSISSKKLVIEGARRFICKGSPLILQIDPTVYVPGLDRVLLNTFCKFINFGNIGIKGFPVFTDVFEEAAENIDKLVEEYYLTQDGS